MKGWTVIAWAAVVMAAPSPLTAQATLAPGVQGFKLTGTVDRFPCFGGTCGGTLSGIGTATVTGQTTNGGEFAATWPDPTQPLPASNTTGSLYNFVDFCPVGGPTPSPNGSGTGSFSLAGGLLNVMGQGLSSGATLAGTFGFIREGSGVVLTISAATITNSSGLVIATQANLVVGVGGGVFAVTSGVPTCGAPLTSPTIQFTAEYLAPE